MKRFFFFLFAVLHYGLTAQHFFNQYKEDANTYIRHYSRPLFEANLYNFSDGWIQRAKPLKTLSFALQITANYSFIPENKQKFTFNPSEYTYVSLADSLGNPVGPQTLPTVFGKDTDFYLHIKAPSNSGGTYDYVDLKAPKGFKRDIEEAVKYFKVGMPGVNIQLNAGLPFQSEIMIRYFPQTNYAGFEANLLGIGLKHEIGHYFLEDESNLHLAAFAVYAGGKIQAAHEDLDDLTAIFKINSYQVGGAASLDFKFLSLYGSAAYIRGTSAFQLTGTYTYTYDILDTNDNVIGQGSETISDPLDLHFAVNTFRISTGIYLNLKFLRIFAQYNFQKYHGFQAGISANI